MGADVNLDLLIDRWRFINAADRRPWVLFEHGTCVVLDNPADNLIDQALGLIGEPSLQPTDPVNNLKVTSYDERGWLVTGGQTGVHTYVEKMASAAESGGDDQTVVLWGRSMHDLDAREGGVVHIEDPRDTPDKNSIRRADAWAHLVRKAEQAEGEGSDWGRFGLPVSAVKLLDESEQDKSPPPLDTLDLAPAVRDTSEVLEEMVHDAPPPPRPFTLFTGLQPGPFVDAITLRADVLASRFPRDRIVSLTGFVSAAGRTEPPLYAAKATGAMMAIRVSHAAPLTKPGDGPDEYEFLLPRDCRCRVIDVLEEGLFPNGSGSGGRSHRVTLRLEQLHT